MPLLIFLLVSIVATTLYGWFDGDFQNRWMGHPARIYQKGEWYRLISTGFIHADPMHLAFNLNSLYLFGEVALVEFSSIWGVRNGQILFLLLYFGGILSASLVAYWRHYLDPYERSLGASAGVVSLMALAIMNNPWRGICASIWLPIPIPGIIYLGLYLFYCHWAIEQRKNSGIGHQAHLVGGLYGLCFFLILKMASFFLQ